MKNRCFKCNIPVSDKESWYGLHHECFKQWFGVSSLDKFQNIASERYENDSPHKAINSSFFHGKFRKYSSTLGDCKYILKVEESDYPELPITEYLCNQIFNYLHIDVPPFYLIVFEEEHLCFVTKNFMTDFLGSNLIHIYHFFDKNMLYDCESLLQIINEKTGRISAMEDFIYLTLADSLIGNNDRHGRNLGLIQTPKGFVLAPFYDNPSYLGTEIHSLLGADHQPAGAIFTKFSAAPSMKDYIQEWNSLGYGYVVDRFRKAVCLEDLHDLIKKSFLTNKRQEALFRLISKRSNDLWA
ncbi:MAG: HipA domain-containing protein [Chlamydiae bacterium]|nr:HipA domain-containing protein [Chlamydiota bacterium]